jgi:hypothetical protein
MRGQGLFARGFHFSGRVTSGGISLLCLCDACHGTFRLQSFHAGFSEIAYFYCSRGPHTLAAKYWVEDAPPLLVAPDPAALRRFEARVPPCAACGGDFRYMNPFRCPLCLAPYIDFHRHPGLREREYYGNRLYGGTLQWWKPG